MAKVEWTKLNNFQIGRYGEYFAKMEFTAYGFDVYSSEVDDHGVDFIAKNKVGEYLEVQVKTICKTNYMFIPKDKLKIDDKHIVALLRLEDNEEPEMFVFPATVWEKPNLVFKDRSYGEWGVNYSKKNKNLIEKYSSATYLPKLFARKQGKIK